MDRRSFLTNIFRGAAAAAIATSPAVAALAASAPALPPLITPAPPLPLQGEAIPHTPMRSDARDDILRLLNERMLEELHHACEQELFAAIGEDNAQVSRRLDNFLQERLEDLLPMARVTSVEALGRDRVKINLDIVLPQSIDITLTV